MSVHIIILAQGSQSRLPALTVPKQLVRLPMWGEDRSTGGVPILTRTLRQLWLLLAKQHEPYMVTVVGWDAIRDYYAANPLVINEVVDSGAGVKIYRTLKITPEFTSLPGNPGNSSLRGLAKYLFEHMVNHTTNRRVVLLGDVVYSWKCLERLLEPEHAITFAGTSDLSQSGGELWGIAWHTGHKVMEETLKVAVAKHPKVDDTYQPGQMRRWWWEVRDHFGKAPLVDMPRGGIWVAVDDYTMDLDTPADLMRLHAAAAMAMEDDTKHGVTW